MIRVYELLDEARSLLDEIEGILKEEKPEEPPLQPPAISLPPLRNMAKEYGVDVRQVPDLEDLRYPYYRCICVKHLMPEQNRSRHAVFVRVNDEYGNRIYDPSLRIGWTWEGRHPNQGAPPAKLDKPDGILEMGHGNIDLYNGMVVSCWIESADQSQVTVSDTVTGIHTNHPDERAAGGEIWNSIGHHSFLVVFQLVNP